VSRRSYDDDYIRYRSRANTRTIVFHYISTMTATTIVRRFRRVPTNRVATRVYLELANRANLYPLLSAPMSYRRSNGYFRIRPPINRHVRFRKTQTSEGFGPKRVGDHTNDGFVTMSTNETDGFPFGLLTFVRKENVYFDGDENRIMTAVIESFLDKRVNGSETCTIRQVHVATFENG